MIALSGKLLRKHRKLAQMRHARREALAGRVSLYHRDAMRRPREAIPVTQFQRAWV